MARKKRKKRNELTFDLLPSPSLVLQIEPQHRRVSTESFSFISTNNFLKKQEALTARILVSIDWVRCLALAVDWFKSRSTSSFDGEETQAPMSGEGGDGG